jgi:hypothetical protein
MKYAELRPAIDSDGQVRYTWHGEAHLPIKLGEEYFWANYCNQPLPYSFPFKVIVAHSHLRPPSAIAVRTDVQPLWWIFVAVRYELEQIAERLNEYAMFLVWRTGFMDLEPGMCPSWRRLT